MNDIELKKFEAEKTRIIQHWETLGSENESEYEQGTALQKLICELTDLRSRYQRASYVAAGHDDTILEQLQNLEMLEPEHAIFEGCMRRLRQKPAEAVRYISNHVKVRSRMQSKRASKQRPQRHDSITCLINELVNDQPSASSKAIGRELACLPNIQLHDGLFRNMDDHTEMKESALPARVTRAKKRLGKKSR